jgi:hypothetical protein
MVPQLNELFGDHTFFLDSNGLNIVEPTVEATRAGTQAARVVNLANWTDADLTSLAPHEPKPTDALFALCRSCAIMCSYSRLAVGLPSQITAASSPA